jgi:TupA-like ATPgrasp
LLNEDLMSAFAWLDRRFLPLKQTIARLTAPDPAKLGHPLFSERIADRRRRWQTEGQPNPFDAVSSKTDGAAYMQSLGYSVPKVYGIYPSLDQIPKFEDLPRNVVLKPTDGWSGAGVFLLRDGVDVFSKQRLSRDALIQVAKSYSGAGRSGINGPWIAEELLDNFDRRRGKAYDHKFYCFGPKVVAIHIINRKSRRLHENEHWARDPDWRPLPIRLRWGWYPEPLPLPRPPFLNEMLKMASDAGGRLNAFLRIDMYATSRGPVFGEFTGYPNGGNGYTPRANAWLGSHWKTLDGGIEVPEVT